MSFFSQLHDKVTINGESFDLKEFMKIEPNYSLPDGAIGVVYRPGERKYYIMEDNYQVNETPKWMDGDRYINRINDLKILIEDEIIENDIRKKEIQNIKKIANTESKRKQVEKDLKKYFRDEKNIQN